MPKPQPQETDEPPQDIPLYDQMIEESGHTIRVAQIRNQLANAIAESIAIPKIETDEDKVAVAGTVKNLMEVQKQLQSARRDVVRHCEAKPDSVRGYFDGLISQVKKTRLKLQAELA